MKNKILNYIIISLIFIIILVLIFITWNKKDNTIFTINVNNLYIKKGSTEKISYTLSDDSKIISWKSSDESIATINNNGEVFAKELGISLITGSINISGKEKTISCIVNVVSENYGIILQDVMIPDGEILLSTSNTYQIPLSYIPNNAYIENIQYIIENNDIISINKNQITALKPGSTNLRIIINNRITKEIKVNVTDNIFPSQIITPVNELLFENDETINTNENMKLSYHIEPKDAVIFNTTWESSDETIATIDENGMVKGLKNGITYITLTVNNTIKKTIKVTVKSKLEKVEINYNPKQLLKVGETLTIYPTIIPSDAEDDIIIETSNPSVLTIINKNIYAKQPGSASISIKSASSNFQKQITFDVINKYGTLNTTKYIWAFSKNADTIPKKADLSFFTNLVLNGKGTISDNKYNYQKYSYDIKNSILTINNSNKILMRMYYPTNKDLSQLNTFTFVGGIGEKDFNDYFAQIEKNPDILKSSGIIILIANGTGITHQANNIVEATNFVKLIINQNPHARNNIGGYSNGGPVSCLAANIGDYQKLMIFNTSITDMSTVTNLINKEIYVYIAKDDPWGENTTFLNHMYNNNYQNVSIITNSPTIINKFNNKFLIINPGSSMASGHTSSNITKSKYFSFGCD